MKIIESANGIELVREPGDKRIAKESTVVFHLRRILMQRDRKAWRRINPSRIGLTGCRLGVAEGARWNGRLFWHERYQIEDAARAFNAGSVYFQAA